MVDYHSSSVEEPNPLLSAKLKMAQDSLEPEEGYFRPDFKAWYAERELNWSRLHISGKPDDVYADECPYEHDDRWRGIRWVFWSRQDDYPDRLLCHDDFVGSKSDACPSPDVRENIRFALHGMILDPCLRDTLVQFWAPTKTSEGRTLLTTQSQPFALAETFGRNERQRLCEYRMVMCREYNNCFYADAGSGEDQLGVPGRVFLHKLPEFNEHVEYCSLKEYPQRDLALRCGIGGYLALPVFERSSQNCVGVLEISMQYILMDFRWYKKDSLRHVLDRFQEFGLQCFSGCIDCEMQDEDEDEDEDEDKDEDEDEDKDEDKNKTLALALMELEYIFELVCKIHELHLAMTWVPCSTCDHLFRGKHVFMEEVDFSLEDVFFLEEVKAMLKTCHLRKGQVTGRILTFPKLSYCSDVKQFSIAEYPLVPTVRRLDLSGCFTMCLQSSWTGSELYVLEFFLPPISEDGDNILTKLSSILRTVEENSKTFKLACSQESGGGLAVEVIDFPNGQISRSDKMIEDSRFFPTLVPLKDGGGMLQLDQPDQPSMEAVNSQMNGVSEARNYNLPSVEPLQNGEVVTQLDSSDQSSMDPANNGQDFVTAKRNILEVTSSEESKRKTQKIEHRKSGFKIEVSLEDILKCSEMRRDDAAWKLKVSTSTLKRLCRDNGINRWPPRNMKTVHSPRPLPFENQEQTPRLSPDLPSNQVSTQEQTPRLSSDLPSNQVSAQEQTPRLSSDLPSNQVSASVVHIKPACQVEDLVTIKAKYENYKIKFRLSLLATLVELHQEVAKRLNLEADSYYVMYKDEEDEWILIACDDDLQDCARYFRSVGKTPIAVQLRLRYNLCQNRLHSWGWGIL